MISSQKTAIVTGGAQGIGKAISEKLLRESYQVVLADSDKEAGLEAENILSGRGVVKFIMTDVSNELSVRDLIEQTIQEFKSIDILVNNAAILNNKPVTELSLDEWNRVIGVNLTGVFLCAKYAAKHLKETKGSIVNIASTRAFMSEPNTEAYSASKGGIVALTHALAVSLGPDVRVNSISPGWIDVSGWKKNGSGHQENLRLEDHSQHPAGRVGKPEDIASLVSYLVSDEAGFITGANFMVDGGMTRKMIYV